MKLTWYGHACFKLETAEGSAVFDPYSDDSVPGLSLTKLTADEVICSHGHGDHNAACKVELTGKTPKYGKKQISTFHDDKNGALRGTNLVTVIDAEGLRIAHLGDLGHELSAEQLAELGRVDVLMIPVGGFYTIDGKTAAKVSGAIGAGTIIPMHYRGEGFGYGVIGTVDEFLGEFDNVCFADSNVLELGEECENTVVVLKCPV